MLARLYSFKFIISAALLWLGALAYGLAIYSTHVYRNHAIETQIESLQIVLERESRTAIQELADQQKLFALQLQSEAPFLETLKTRDGADMEAWLAARYEGSLEASNAFRLKNIIVRDLSGSILAQISDDGFGYTGCPIAHESISASSSQPLKPTSLLCSFDGQLYSDLQMRVAIQGTGAYLQVVAYAADGLRNIESNIGMPLKIIHGSGNSLYQSDSWVDEGEDSHVYPSYKLYGDDAFLAATISASYDRQQVIDGLAKTETSFFIITTIATISALVLVLIMLNRAFLPMNKLRNSVGALLTGKYASIGNEKLPNELKDLVVAYNEMVEGLEVETISRRQIEEKLRSEKDFISTTLNSITNPVIVIDSKQRIKLVNPSAEKFIWRQGSCLDRYSN